MTPGGAVPVEPRRWLSAVTKPHAGSDARRAAALTAADALPAIGFAAGLAGGVSHLPQGPAAAAPWLILAVAALTVPLLGAAPSTTASAAPKVTATAAQPVYVALGDSYAAGDGAGSYLRDGTSCYRSLKGYPGLIAAFGFCSGVASFILVDRQAGVGKVIAVLMLLSWAYARAEAQALVPIEYSAFIWSAIIGRIVFDEPLTAATVAGVVLIVAACLIAARRPTEQTALA